MSESLNNPVTKSLPMEIPESLYQLLDILSAANFEAYIAGGAVRDTILGKTPKDYDISTNAAPKDVIKYLEPYVKFAGIQGEKSFMVARLVAYDGNEYEFAPYRVDEGSRKGGSAILASSIQEDVMRRDLTINALFYRVPSMSERKEGAVGEVVDYVGGIEDIENEIIRTVGDPEERFREDRLRILRAFRFAGRVNGELDEASANAIRKNNSLTSPSEAAVSEERIREEIIKGVASAKIPANYINMLIDFGLFAQILPGLKAARAFSSSKNIAVQFASVLMENRPNDVAKVLFDKKFGNDIKSAVKFLLNLSSLNRDNLVDLKKEYDRIRSSSNDIISDEVILEFGAVTGYNFNKFIDFAKSPPVVSARELISGGMRPGPEVGRAIRDAEIEAYFKENLGDSSNISNANLNITKKLIKLSLLLDTFGEFSETKELSKIIEKFANVGPIIPDLSGHVYIFDMDDTLFWSPEWHNLARFNEEGLVEQVNNYAPNLLSRVVSFVNDVNLSPEKYIRGNVSEEQREELAQEFRDEIGRIYLEKELVDLPWLGKHNQVVIVAKNDRRENILPNVMKKFFSSKYTKLFDLRGKYMTDAVVIAGDPKFYQAPETLGVIPNSYILDIYNKNSENAIILTARESVPGMEEGILKRILDAGSPAPIHIFTKPKGESSGKYKGYVIGRIASQEAVTKVTFYDDNLKYITSVNEVLDKEYSSVRDKVEINLVNIEEKPEKGLLEGEHE